MNKHDLGQPYSRRSQQGDTPSSSPLGDVGTDTAHQPSARQMKPSDTCRRRPATRSLAQSQRNRPPLPISRAPTIPPATSSSAHNVSTRRPPLILCDMLNMSNGQNDDTEVHVKKRMIAPDIVAISISAGDSSSRCEAEPVSIADSRQCAPLAASMKPKTIHSGDNDHTLQPDAVSSDTATVHTDPSAAPAASSPSISPRTDTLLPYDSQHDLCSNITSTDVISQEQCHLAASLSTTPAFGPGSAPVLSDAASTSATMILRAERTEMASGSEADHALSSDFGASVPAPFNLALDVAPPPKQSREVIRISPRTILRASAEGLAESCRLENVSAHS